MIAYRRWGGHAYIRAAHVTRALEALHRHPGVPQTLSYSQHYAPHLRAPAAALPDAEIAAPQLPAVPSFAQLLAGGRVGQGNPLLLDFDTGSGAELVGSWPEVEHWLGNLAALIGANGLPRRVKPTSQTGQVLAQQLDDTSLARYIVAKGLAMHGYPDAEIAALLWHFCQYDKAAPSARLGGSSSAAARCLAAIIAPRRRG